MADPVDLLPLLFEASAEPAQWGTFLKGLSEQIDSRIAFLMARDEMSQRCTVMQWGAEPDALRQYMDYYWSIDIFAQVVPQRGFSEPYTVSAAEAFVSDRELLATEYANDFLLKFHMFRHCFAHLGTNKETLSTLSAVRNIGEEPFEERELRIVRFLAPHIRQALRIGERFHQLKMENQLRKAALNQLPLGVVFLDGSGKILGMNQAAETVLAVQDGLSNHKGRLRATFPREDLQLQAAVSSAAKTGSGHAGGVGGALRVSRNYPRKPLQLMIGPACTSVPDLPSMPAAVVFIHDLSAQIKPRPDLLKSLFGLTPAEARLACLILDGKSSEEITALLGITKNTFKTQMQSIFSKTGVRRQSELMRVLMYFPTDQVRANERL